MADGVIPCVENVTDRVEIFALEKPGGLRFLEWNVWPYYLLTYSNSLIALFF